MEQLTGFSLTGFKKSGLLAGNIKPVQPVKTERADQRAGAGF